MQYAVPELFSAPQVGHEDTERARLDSEELAHISLESDVFVFFDFEDFLSILRLAEFSRLVLNQVESLLINPGPFGSVIACSSTIVLMPIFRVSPSACSSGISSSLFSVFIEPMLPFSRAIALMADRPFLGAFALDSSLSMADRPSPTIPCLLVNKTWKACEWPANDDTRDPRPFGIS